MPGPIAVHDDMRAHCRLCDFVSPEQPDWDAADAAATEHIEECHSEIEDA